MTITAFDHENTPASAYGEFETYGLPVTDEEWADYDAYLAAEIDRWEATVEDEDGFYFDPDLEPPF